MRMSVSTGLILMTGHIHYGYAKDPTKPWHSLLHLGGLSSPLAYVVIAASAALVLQQFMTA